MSILDKFKPNPDRALPVQDVLDKDTIHKVTTNFVDEHLRTASGVLIIWIENGSVKYDAGGLNKYEAIGCLETISHSIGHNDLPEH